MSWAKDGPRVSLVLNHVRSVNRSVLSANRSRETTLGVISTSNRIRLLLFYYAVKAILNHLWDALVPQKGLCLVFNLSANALQFLKGIRVTIACQSSVILLRPSLFLLSFFFFFLETARRCGFLDINDFFFQELGL